MSMPRAVLVITMSALLLAGCKPEPPGRTRSESDQPVEAVLQASASVAVDPATAGSISGVVRWDGKLPERLRIDMSQDPVCSMTGGQNDAEQFVIKGGKLANVYLYVKSGPSAAMHAAAALTAPAAVIDQKGCRYVPHVIAIQQGRTVEFRNSDSTMHNIHTMPTVAGNEVIDVSQGPKGAPQVRRFELPEVMMPVRCNNHPWMNAFINVSATPFFAVSGADGSFKLTGLPAGEYTLGAVHEKLGEKTVQVTVKAQDTSESDVHFTAAK